jgi:hypothetical protein
MVVMVVKLVEAAKVQGGITEILRTIGKRRIGGSAFITSGKGISSRTV